MIIQCSLYNEMPWTPYILNHLLEYDCPIILGEGLTRWDEPKDITDGEHCVPFSLRSTDGTYEYIKEFASKHSNITFIPHNFDLKYKTTGELDKKHFPRLQDCVRQIAWDRLDNGEWLMVLDADNFYLPEDIKKIKEVMYYESVTKSDIWQIMTPQRVFVFNFNTIVTQPSIPGLCGPWYKYWPLIWRKEPHLCLPIGNELLLNKKTALFIASAGSQKYDTINHVRILQDVNHFHYKGVKSAKNRYHRYGKKASNFEQHPLTASYLETYNGPHPSILNSHPWRYEKDSRLCQI